MFEPLQIRYAKIKSLLGLAVGLVFTLMLFTTPDRRFWYWVVFIVLQILNNLYIFKALFNRDIILTIDDLGIHDRRLGDLHIPWERIESVSSHYGERIFLNMNDTTHLGLGENLLSVFYKPISKIGKPGVLIDARGLEYDFDHIVEILAGRMEYHKENSERLVS